MKFRLSARAARWRLALPLVALAVVPASLALSTSPAHADTSTCVDANAQQVYNYGAIIQFDCNTADPYQKWTTELVPTNPNLPPPPSGQLVQLENVGALIGYNAADCLDANSQDVRNGGAIIQFGCDAGDPWQDWIMNENPVGTYTFQNYGAYLRGEADCLDANAQELYNYGAVTQYACNSSDVFQQWQPIGRPAGVMLLRSVGSL